MVLYFRKSGVGIGFSVFFCGVLEGVGLGWRSGVFFELGFYMGFELRLFCFRGFRGFVSMRSWC